MALRSTELRGLDLVERGIQGPGDALGGELEVGGAAEHARYDLLQNRLPKSLAVGLVHRRAAALVPGEAEPALLAGAPACLPGDLHLAGRRGESAVFGGVGRELVQGK